MKRKVCLWTVITALVSLSSLFAQGPYIKGLGGYALGFPKNFLGTETSINSGVISSINDVYHSVGKGLKLHGAMGFPLSTNIALQLESGISILGGVTLENEVNSGEATVTSKMEVSAWHIPILTTVIITGGESGSMRPYVGAGAGIYLYSISSQWTNSDDQSLLKEDNKVKLPIGFHGLLGTEFPMGEKKSFFVELRLVSLGLTQSEDVMTGRKDSDGKNILNEVSADNKVQKYEKNSIKEPAPEVLSASNLGLFFGLKIGLN